MKDDIMMKVFDELKSWLSDMKTRSLEIGETCMKNIRNHRKNGEGKFDE